MSDLHHRLSRCLHLVAPTCTTFVMSNALTLPTWSQRTKAKQQLFSLLHFDKGNKYIIGDQHVRHWLGVRSKEVCIPIRTSCCAIRICCFLINSMWGKNRNAFGFMVSYASNWLCIRLNGNGGTFEYRQLYDLPPNLFWCKLEWLYFLSSSVLTFTK